MFRRAVNGVEVLALLAAAVFVVLLFANEPGSTSGAPSSPGAALFAANCARCHGSDGSGGLGPQLSDGKVVKAFPDPADEVQFVTRGQDGMPAFGNSLSPTEIEQVVQYTRTLK
jgi:mono/diheme cytochrome c family protein